MESYEKESWVICFIWLGCRKFVSMSISISSALVAKILKFSEIFVLNRCLKKEYTEKPVQVSTLVFYLHIKYTTGMWK